MTKSLQKTFCKHCTKDFFKSFWDIRKLQMNQLLKFCHMSYAHIYLEQIQKINCKKCGFGSLCIFEHKLHQMTTCRHFGKLGTLIGLFCMNPLPIPIVMSM